MPVARARARSWKVCLAVALLLAAANLPATSAVEQRLAVLEFDNPQKVDIDRTYFSDLARGAAQRRLPGLFVMTRESTDALLQANGKTLADCTGECEVEVGRKLGADFIVSGRITRIGTRLLVTLRLFSTADGRLLDTEEARGKSADELLDEADKAVQRLVDPLARALAPAQPGPAGTSQQASATPQQASATPQSASATPQQASATPQSASATPQPDLVTPQPAPARAQSPALAPQDREQQARAHALAAQSHEQEAQAHALNSQAHAQRLGETPAAPPAEEQSHAVPPPPAPTSAASATLTAPPGAPSGPRWSPLVRTGNELVMTVSSGTLDPWQMLESEGGTELFAGKQAHYKESFSELKFSNSTTRSWTRSYFAQGARGVEMLGTRSFSLSTGYVSESETRYDPPILAWPKSLKPGSSWHDKPVVYVSSTSWAGNGKPVENNSQFNMSAEGKVTTQEELTTASGTYRCAALETENTTYIPGQPEQHTTLKTWFAPSVGWVEMDIVSHPANGKDSTTRMTISEARLKSIPWGTKLSL